MIVIDTSALVDSLSGRRHSLPFLRRLIADGQRLVIPSLVLYEWLRGPRLEAELADQNELFPVELAIAFGPAEAAVAAELYRTMRRSRGREIDLAIAATALVRDASVWTLNRDDFSDIPGLQLV